MTGHAALGLSKVCVEHAACLVCWSRSTSFTGDRGASLGLFHGCVCVCVCLCVNVYVHVSVCMCVYVEHA